MTNLFGSLTFVVLIPSVVTNIYLGWKVFLSNPNSATNRTYSVLSGILSIWMIVIFMASQDAQSAAHAIFWAKSSIFVAAPLTLSFFVFTYTTPSETNVLSKKWLIILSGITAVVMAISLSHYSFPLAAEIDGVYQAVPGPGMTPFGIVSTVFSISALYQLIKKTKQASGERRKAYLYILGGLLTMCALSIMTIFFPVFFYNNQDFVPFAPLYALFFMIMTAYALIKHKYLDLKVIATEVFVVILCLLFLSRVFLADNFNTFALELFFFLGTIFFGYLLTQSVTREVKQAEQLTHLNNTLKTKNAQLEELLKMKTEFVGIASHQLRTPLTVLRGLLDMQLSGDFKSLSKKRVRELQENMLASSVRLIQLVNDLMESTKMEGGIKLNLQTVHLDDILQKIIKEMGDTYKEKGLYLRLKSDKTAPEIVGDPEYLHEAFSNLVDNAEKYTEKGGTRIQLSSEEDEIIVTISDTGIGLSDDDKKRLFQKFSRGVRSQSMHTEGTGLGLYIVKRIVEAHHGTVTFESEGVNKGTTFTIRLPLTQS